MFLLLFSLVARADCVPAELDPALDRAEAAYAAGDRPGLSRALKEAKKTLACATPNSTQAARLLRGRALTHALSNSWPDAEAELRASIAAHPLLPFPPMLQKDQRLHLAWQRAQEMPITWTVEQPALINGTMTPFRPDTKLLGERRGGKKTAARLVGAGLGLAAAGLYGAAWGSRLKYDDALAEDRNADALKHYKSTNALSVGSAGVVLAGAGLIGVSFAL